MHRHTNRKSWILFVYFSLLFSIFGLQFTGAVYLYVKSINYFKEFKNRILYAIKYQYGQSAVHSRALDYLHYNFKCCGWNSPKDWIDSNYIDPKYTFKTNENVITVSPSFVYKIPHSCCVNNYDLTCVLMHKFHEIGCESIVKSYYLKIEIYVAWSIAFLNLFQLVLLVLSLYLLCMIFFDKQKATKYTHSQNTDGYSTSSSSASSFNGYESFNQATNNTTNANHIQQNNSQNNQDLNQLYMTSYYL